MLFAEALPAARLASSSPRLPLELIVAIFEETYESFEQTYDPVEQSGPISRYSANFCLVNRALLPSRAVFLYRNIAI